METKLFYIKERYNPQFDKPYYVRYGQLSKTETKEKEASLYGDNYMTSYNTEKEYNDAIEKLKTNGFNVQ